MRHILFLFLLLLGGCMPQSKRTTLSTQSASYAVKDTTYNKIIGDTAYLQLTNHTIEDTVRYQIGGKLYHNAKLNPDDSITVIKTFYSPIPEGDRKYFNNLTQYREYHFIVHNRHSRAHSYFEVSALDRVYNTDSYRNDYEKIYLPRLNAEPSKYIDTTIKDFNGFWVYLHEYKGDYYLDDDWSLRHRSFCIADSIFTYLYQDGPDPRKIEEAISLPDNGISLFFDGDYMKIEVVDKEKCVYRFRERFNDLIFIAPARAIHNFEIIQHTNNTGDLM